MLGRIKAHSALATLAISTVFWAAPTPVRANECPLGAQELCDVQAAMGGSLITPQVVPLFEPKGYLHLLYDNIDVGPAQQFPPERVALQPLVQFNISETGPVGPPYVLIVVDPDASAVHTSQSCALNWLVTDVYFDPKTGLMTSGFVSAPYVRPNPPEGPLHHRYVFLLYQQPLLFLPPVFGKTMAGARSHFNLPLFVLDYGLTWPVGGNFIKSFWTGKALPQALQEQLAQEQAKERTQVKIKAHANPYVAALIGSVMGFLYSASS